MMTEMERKLIALIKIVKERYYEIASLKNQMNVGMFLSQIPTVKVTDKGKAIILENQSQHSTMIA